MLCDEQISWATAERTAPDLACVIPVGYSVIAWIDGKEKVGGSIPPGGSTQGLDLRTYLFCLVLRPGCCCGHQSEEGRPAVVAGALTCVNVGAALAAVLQRRQNR